MNKHRPMRHWMGATGFGLATLIGLLSALIGEGGGWWALSWAALAWPTAASAVYLVRGLN